MWIGIPQPSIGVQRMLQSHVSFGLPSLFLGPDSPQVEKKVAPLQKALQGRQQQQQQVCVCMMMHIHMYPSLPSAT